MLKPSFFLAVAFGVVTMTASIAYAQGQGSRQIVIDPAEVESGPIAEPDSAGVGTGEATKDLPVKDLPIVDVPSAATPGDEVNPPTGVATDEGQAKQAVVEEPPLADGPDVSGFGAADPGEAIVGDAPDEAPSTEEPAEKAVTAAPRIEIDSPGELITFLKSKGYNVDLDHRLQNGDYVFVVSTEQDNGFGYLLTVDQKHGKVTAKQRIELEDYGYGPAKEYDPGEDDDGGYSDGGPEGNGAYRGGHQDNNAYGEGGGTYGGSDY
jgi:hypothetical protein